MRALPAALACAVTLLALESRADDLLRVKATTRIDARASSSHGALLLQGQVRDDLAAPIAGAAVTLELATKGGASVPIPDIVHGTTSCTSRAIASAGSSVNVATDEAGRFCVRAPLVLGQYVATVSVAGTDYLSAAHGTFAADLTRQAVVLAFDPEPRLVAIDGAAADLEATASYEVEGLTTPATGLPLTLTNEAGATIGTSLSDARGRARFHLEPFALGGPGRGELVLAYAGSDTNAESVHHAPIERDARVSLAPKDLVRSGVSEEGIPITLLASNPHATITSGSVEARVGDVVVGAAPVQPTGEANLLVTFAAPREREVPLRVRYVSDAPWLKPGDELLINLPVDAPSPLRQVPLIILGAALAAWLIVGRLAQRKVSQPRAPTTSRTVPDGVAGISILGAPRSRRGPLVGRVVDAHDGSPVVRARVAIEEARMEDVRVVVSVFTDADGRFKLDDAGGAAMHLVCEGPLHTALRQPMPQASEVEIALVLRKRKVLERLVRWARERGAPFDAKPEPTPGHVRRAADRDESDVERWAEAVERAAYDDRDVDARTEAELDALAPPRGRPGEARAGGRAR